MIKIRASSLGLIMTDAKSVEEYLITPDIAPIAKKKIKSDDEREIMQGLLDQSLSVGAKTFLEDIAKEFVYGFHAVVGSKYMDKGRIVEEQSIALYNSVFFTNLSKNTERRTNEWLTGECDLFTGQKVIDIKSSWTLATFPATAAAGADKQYEWQGRAYMMLWDVEAFDIAYCMVNTPDELIRFEQEDLHFVDHLDEALRITIVSYQRDRALEEKIKTKVGAARRYLAKVIEDIKAQHTHGLDLPLGTPDEWIEAV